MMARLAKGRPFANTLFQFLAASFSCAAPRFCLSLCLYLVKTEAVTKNKSKIINHEISPKYSMVNPIGIAVRTPDLSITLIL